ncbi:MAG TPA: hypothetical protein VKH46_13795 [Thermoanaerobaculia bacterium]|nr:hypothetical protein [Thermoanaerobaculia bacterium]
MTNEHEKSGATARTGQRFAKRISGEGWAAAIKGVRGDVRVLKVSRIGIEIETECPLENGGRYPIRLTHGGETTQTTFYVLRSPEHRNVHARQPLTYRPAGVFVETLERRDLPEFIPPHPHK